MNKFAGGGIAMVEYRDSNIRVIRPGRYVVCAVTGEQIALEQLKYWSVPLQEPYASPDAVRIRLAQIAGELQAE